MDTMWSPWRMKYIMNYENPGKCIFCTAPMEADGPGNLIVHRGKLCFVILNRFPYTNGHAMVVPYEHKSSLEALTPEIRCEMMEMVTETICVMRKVYKPQGFNIGVNIGSAAGAGIAEHVHMHIVPRWNGDTNFMSTVGETRVLPEELEDTYSRLVQAWNK
jgi:ATP adenylyltransferase